MTLDLMGELRFLRRHPDWLLTLLTAVLALMIFVFARDDDLPAVVSPGHATAPPRPAMTSRA